ncbi:MAG: CMP/dCMP kinase [Frankiaceae bacterium]|nr:CMP/dCMP kinase [Frankiaceae bacterium]
MQQRAASAPLRAGTVVAIDGPSGSGKSTVAREVARSLGFRYLDTGAMYRALTWLALRRGLDLTDAGALTALAESAELELSTDPDRPGVRVDGTDVTTEIRSEPVTAAVSTTSAVPGVRAEMVRRQREAIRPGDGVVEGRDSGTTVAPDATGKVFLTADPAARAARRGRELAGPALDDAVVAATQEALLRRDTADAGRAASPLTQAPDALVVDATDLTADAVVEQVLAAVRAAGAQRGNA